MQIPLAVAADIHTIFGTVCKQLRMQIPLAVAADIQTIFGTVCKQLRMQIPWPAFAAGYSDNV